MPTAPPTLTEFTFFPNLATELRREIYSHAAEPKRGWLRARVERSVADSELEIICFKFSARSHSNRTYDTGVSLLATCPESREVCMRVLSATLPGEGRSLIRYDPTRTTIFIENFQQIFMGDDLLVEGIRRGWRRQAWVKGIKRLATDVECFAETLFRFNRGFDDRSLGDILAVFPNLENWTVLVDETKMEGPPSGARLVRFIEKVAVVVRKNLAHYRRSHDSDFKPPMINVKYEAEWMDES